MILLSPGTLNQIVVSLFLLQKKMFSEHMFDMALFVFEL